MFTPSTRTRAALASVLASILSCAWAAPAHAQLLETETARLLRGGTWKVGGAWEAQRSVDGREVAAPLVIAVGLTDRVELVVEPVPYASIRPKRGSSASGGGDVEVTLSYGVSGETKRRPAFVIAAESKLPTARNPLIGTGKSDYTGYLIASKRFGRLDTHVNASYAVLGSPNGVSLRNVVGGALGATYGLARRTALFGEVLSTTAAAPDGEGGDTPVAGKTIPPEVAGAETFGTVGLSALATPSTLLFAGITYDNNRATMLRLGFTRSFGSPRAIPLPAR